jgi:uncharacterized protein (DUF362 family)
LCRQAGARQVIITDNSCNDPRRCFRRSGVGRAGADAGATVLLPERRHFKAVDMGGVVLGRRPVLRPFLEADKVINLPVLKQHNLCGMTVGMKNWYGIIGGIRAQLHQDIHDSIADLAWFLRPTLIVLDVTRMMVSNGPSGGSPADVRRMNTVAAGVDQVAVDTYGATLLGLDPAAVPFLRLAQERGLGTMNLTTLNIYRTEPA